MAVDLEAFKKAAIQVFGELPAVEICLGHNLYTKLMERLAFILFSEEAIPEKPGMPLHRCPGCGMKWTEEKAQSLLDWCQEHDSIDDLDKFDWHCASCAAAEKLRREVLTGPPSDGYVLLGHDIDMLAATSFELGLVGADNEPKADHFKWVLAACLVRKIDPSKVVPSPPGAEDCWKGWTTNEYSSVGFSDAVPRSPATVETEPAKSESSKVVTNPPLPHQEPKAPIAYCEGIPDGSIAFKDAAGNVVSEIDKHGSRKDGESREKYPRGWHPDDDKRG